MQIGVVIPSFTRLPSDRWRAQVRRQGHTLSRTFRLKQEAEDWARDQETRIGRGETPMGTAPVSREIHGDLIDLHFADLHELNRSIGRSKEATLLRIKDTIGLTRLCDLTRDGLVQFAKKRAKAVPDRSRLASTSASSVRSSNMQPQYTASLFPRSKFA